MPKRNIAGGANDPTVEFAPLVIDGKTYKLAWDFGAIAEAEKATGANLLHGVAHVLYSNDLSASQLLGLFAAAMRKAQPEMSGSEIAALVRIDRIPDIREAILAAYAKSMPGAKVVKNPTEGATENAPES